jgi:LPXTG-motif cell wall-anchored protein
VTPGVTAVVTAVAADDFVLLGTQSWTHVYPVAINCAQTVPAFTQAVCAEAGTVTPATYTIPDITGVSYTVGGVPVAPGTYPIAAGSTVVIDAIGSARYVLSGTTEWTSTAPTLDCIETGTPAAPTFTTQVCTTSFTVVPATLTIPVGDDVVYSVDGAVTSAGTITVGVGTHTVTAAPQPGYALENYPAGGWSTTIIAVPCDAPAVVTSTPLPPAVATPSLAYTGSADRTMLIFGAVLLLVGAGLVLTARRRTR